MCTSIIAPTVQEHRQIVYLVFTLGPGNSRGANSGYRPRKAFCAHVRVECANHDFWLDGFLRHRNRAVGIFKYA